jgi:hypothetical protein
VTISNLTLNGGTNPIDIPFLNQGIFEQLEIVNATGCGISVVAGERYHFNIIGVNNQVSGFAPLCSGDTTKSIFGSLPTSSTYGLSYVDELIVHDIGNLGGSPNVGSHWSLWMADNGIDNSPLAGPISCEYSAITGTVQLGSGTTAMQNSKINGIIRDHCGQVGTPEAIAVYVNGTMTNSTIAYMNTPAAGYETISLEVGCMTNSSSIENSQFSTSVNNTSTFGLYLSCSGTNLGSIKDVQGGVFATNVNGAPTVYGSYLTPTNLSGGVQSYDWTGTGFYYLNYNASGSTAVTTPYTFAREASGGGIITDFTSNGTTAQFNEILSSGTDNSKAGTLNLSNASAAAHTIFSSAATTTNTIAGFATVPTTGDVITCTSASTTCTLTDGGVLLTALAPKASPTFTGIVTYPLIATTSNCSAAGSAASPSVAACTAAPSGAFSCATNASGATCQVTSTAVTTSSNVWVQPTAATAVGTRLSVTCNTTADTGLVAPRVSAIASGSFTINLGTFSTNPECFMFGVTD